MEMQLIGDGRFEQNLRDADVDPIAHLLKELLSISKLPASVTLQHEVSRVAAVLSLAHGLISCQSVSLSSRKEIQCLPILGRVTSPNGTASWKPPARRDGGSDAVRNEASKAIPTNHLPGIPSSWTLHDAGRQATIKRT